MQGAPALWEGASAGSTPSPGELAPQAMGQIDYSLAAIIKFRGYTIFREPLSSRLENLCAASTVWGNLCFIPAP